MKTKQKTHTWVQNPVKSNKNKEKCKQKAYGRIELFNWLVQRYVYDNSKTIPDAVVTYVASVRANCNTICTAIDNCNNLDDFKTVYGKIYNEDGEYYTWPDYTDVKQYERGSWKL